VCFATMIKALRRFEPDKDIGFGEVANMTIILISAVFASLAVGILIAYGTCLALFSLFRAHARQLSERRVVPFPARVV